MADLPVASRDKYRANRNVPIVGKRLAAAIKRRGLSVNGAAKLAKEKQQTVQRIVKGTTIHCRHSRRRNLANALGVPDQWLGGGDERPIPGLPVGTDWTTDAAGAAMSMDEDLTKFPIPGAALPPGYQLHWSLITQRILEAWQRDIDVGLEDAQALNEHFPEAGGDPEKAQVCVSGLLYRVLSAIWWRQRLLTPIPLPEAPPNLEQLDDVERWQLALKNEKLVDAQARGVSAEDVDAFARVAAEAIDLTLQPWIEGRRELNYEAVFILLRWLRGGMLLGTPPGLAD